MKNYTNYAHLRENLGQSMSKFWDVEFNISVSYDDNKNKYLYIHLKDYSDYSEWYESQAKLKSLLNKYEKIIISSDRKILYWIPEEKGLKYLIVDGELYEVEKPKIKVKRYPSITNNSPRLVKKIVLENTNYGHFKEWHGELYSDGTMISKWGRIGDNLASKTFPKVGKDFFYKKYREKLNKGYKQIY